MLIMLSPKSVIVVGTSVTGLCLIITVDVPLNTVELSLEIGLCYIWYTLTLGVSFEQLFWLKHSVFSPLHPFPFLRSPFLQSSL